MTGYVAISRSLWSDPDFADEPMSQREAWIWLIADAAWKPHKVRRNNVTIELQRGQVAHSIRFIAEAWGWHRARVERFLKALKNRDMIETATETGVSVITICNYDKYQAGEKAAETPMSAKRDSSETNYNQDNHKNHKNTCDGFDDFWKGYPRKVGKPSAAKAFKRLDPESQAKAIAALDGYCRAVSQTEPKFIPHPATWLNDRRFDEHRETAPHDTPEDWRKRIRRYADNGAWPHWCGPPPHSKLCKCPADILAEFGYAPANQPDEARAS